jgi:DNA-binding YbaB/EbfC family protein
MISQQLKKYLLRSGYIIKRRFIMKARIPKNLGGGAQNMNAMIKQAQRMQGEITELQSDIEEREFTATAGGGAVEVVLTGKKTVKSLTIKPDVVDKDDIEMLQDLVISAFNEAVNNIEQITEDEMSKITGGVSLPGLF